jgi:hypothetical protein
MWACYLKILSHDICEGELTISYIVALGAGSMQYGSHHGRCLSFGFLHFRVLNLAVEHLHFLAPQLLYSLSRSYVQYCLILLYYYP